MKKAVCFTVADQNNMKYFPAFSHSLRKFHSEEELPIVVYTEKEIKDPINFYRHTPMFAKDLINEYELVISADVDSIFCAPITEVLENKEDVQVVLNSNPRENKKWVVQVWNIPPAAYFNCGFVAMRSKEFIDHWWTLCNKPLFNDYPYKEQDILNILAHYGNYSIKCLDMDDKFYGIASNSYWNHFELRGDDIVLPIIKEDNFMWPIMKEKKIVVLHFAEGQASVSKGNYRIKCNEAVSARLDWLTK